ncbi:MAG: asparagine synthase [Methanomicrobiales archaeon]|nr:asparagine synthase [Methanomicrobiales archaeon]
MILEVHLSNRYCPWRRIAAPGGFCHVRGEPILRDDPRTGDALFHEIFRCAGGSTTDPGAIPEFLSRLYGEFAIVIESDQRITGIVDPIRSIPLFYASSGDAAVLSDDAWYLRSRFGGMFDEISGIEFLLTGFVSGSRSLLDTIFQVPAGTFITITKTTAVHPPTPYRPFLHSNFLTGSAEELTHVLDGVLSQIFDRLIQSTIERKKQIVVPLSGGIDSRLVVGTLKEKGCRDIICFSYGRRTDRNAEISRIVAESLGYPWHFVDMDPDEWYRTYVSEEMVEYQRYAGNFASLPHLQDYIAVRELRRRKILPDNAVFVPGHTGMIAGGRVPDEYSQGMHCTRERFLQDCIRRHYNLWDWSAAEPALRPLIEERILEQIGNITFSDGESCANAIEFFDFNERQAKFIVNSLRIYEYFGYAWKLPFSDPQLIDFFLRVPLKYRIRKGLLFEILHSTFATGPCRALSEIPCTTPAPSFHQQVVPMARSIIRRMLHARGPAAPPWNAGLPALLMEKRLAGREINPRYPLFRMILGERVPVIKPSRINSSTTLDYLATFAEIDLVGERP